MEILDSVKKWIGQLTLIVLALIPLAIVLQILFGGTTEFFGAAVSNLIGLIRQFGDAGMVGLIALALVIWLFGLVRDDTKATSGGSSSY